MTGTFTLHHDENKNKEGSAAVAEASKFGFRQGLGWFGSRNRNQREK